MAKRKKKKAKKDQGAEQKPVSSKVQIQRSFNKATKLLGQMLRGPDPLYRMPFFGVVGAPGTFKGELLADEGLSPRPGCPHDFGVAGASRNDWWFYNNAVVIDFSPAFFEDAAPDEDAAAADAPSGGLMGRLRKRGAANADEAQSVRRRVHVHAVALTRLVKCLCVALGDDGRRSRLSSTTLACRHCRAFWCPRSVSPSRPRPLA